METRLCRLYAEGDIRVETEAVAAPGPGQALVAVAAGGICGSDLHYYREGGFGPIRVREPIVLGHEASGVVLGVGPGVTGLAEGDRVALNPSRPCGRCTYCREGLEIHCLEMRFAGSAMRMPHEQGLFRDRMVVDAAQCVPIGAGASLTEAACAEPLAVCLHARARAGDLAGRRVLVTGAGPIGALCVAVAAEAGAAEIVATDLHAVPLATARAMGATETLDMRESPEALEPYAAEKGSFDVVFECSAAGPAIRAAIGAVRPRGTIVQVGVTGDQAVPINLIVSKEIRLLGTHRFHAEFAEAVAAISTRRIDVGPIVTAAFPLEEARAAFEAAGDRSRAVKVHLAFAGA